MDCGLLALNNGACPAVDGGIFETQVCKLADIATVTLSGAGIVTAVTMASTGLWKKWIYDDNDVAFYNQVGARENNRHTYTQTAFLKFSGLDNAKRLFLEGLTPCCELVAVHFLNNGTAVIQGIENYTSLTTWRRSRKAAKATASVLTDTSAGEDRIEVNLISEARNSSVYTTLTSAALQAL